MKHRLVILLLGLFGASFAQGLSAQTEAAQPRKDFVSRLQVRVGYGNFPTTTFYETGGRLWPSVSPERFQNAPLTYLPYAMYYFDDLRTYGSAHVGVTYELARRWHLTLNLAHTSAWTKYYRTADHSLMGKGTYQFLQAAIYCHYQWYKREKFNLYSGVGLHWTDIDFQLERKAQEDAAMFGPQIVPIGVTYGTDWFGFAELAMGYLNMLQVGVGYRF
ncbi:MAG: hypothetical protein J6U70_07075 [Bacteroidales bacterium]|nr:hypothetical protein [Bacteroidales bacterium]